MKSSILKTLEIYEGSISSTRRTRNSKKPSAALAMPCKIMKNCGSDGFNKIKTRLACILEADESTRLRMEESVPNHHEDHIAGKGHRAPDTGRTGRVGHVPSRGLLRQASAGKTGSHLVCHERDDGSVVAPFRAETSNPASSSWAGPTSRGNHDEADERTERARLALVRARWEAQGGGGATRRESTSTRQVAPTRSQTTEPSILLLLEGRTPAVPSRRGTPRRL